MSGIMCPYCLSKSSRKEFQVSGGRLEMVCTSFLGHEGCWMSTSFRDAERFAKHEGTAFPTEAAELAALAEWMKHAPPVVAKRAPRRDNVRAGSPDG